MYEIFLDYDYDEYEDDNYSNNYATNGTYWFSYETESTVANKVRYVKENGLGGIMAWSIDTEDFLGAFKDPYPLLTTINDLFA